MPSPNALPRSPLQHVRARIAAILAVSTPIAMALLALGKMASDRFLVTQFLSWVPTLLACAIATVVLVVAWAMAMPRYRGRWARRAGWAFVIGGVLYATAIEWGGGHAPPGPPRENRLRVVFWNFNISGEAGWENHAIAQDPDMVVVRAGECTDPNGLRGQIGGVSSFCWHEGFMVASRLPIKAWGTGPLNVSQGLGLDPREKSLVREGRDAGRGMWLILDAKDRLGKEIVFWLVDMPSDPSLSRARAMRDAFVALVGGPPQRWIADGNGGWTEAADAMLPRDAFLVPKIIMGDFNTPHGAYSLQAVNQGFPGAYEQAGMGHAATFPRAWPLWQIDQAFIAPSLRTISHDVLDPGSGTHRMLVIDVANESDVN